MLGCVTITITVSMAAVMPTLSGGSFAINIGAISVIEDALWS
jgi:hypothetical protein